MSEKKDEEKNIKKGSEIYWSFIKILDEFTSYLEHKLFPMLRSQGIDDKTIANLSVLIAVGIEDVLTSQLALVKPTTESIRSLDEVQAAVERIYKQSITNSLRFQN